MVPSYPPQPSSSPDSSGGQVSPESLPSIANGVSPFTPIISQPDQQQTLAFVKDNLKLAPECRGSLYIGQYLEQNFVSTILSPNDVPKSINFRPPIQHL